MEMNRIKWDQSMAVRCLERFGKDGPVAAYPFRRPNSNPTVKKKSPLEKAYAEKAFFTDIVKGEWDDFYYELNKALKKS